MRRLSRLLALWAAVTLGAALAASPELAVASPDAKIDQQIRPCFGLLLQPNLSHGCKVRDVRPKPCPRGTIRAKGRCVVPYSNGGGYAYVSREINCDYAYPGQISDTLYRLYEGDVLTLTSTNGGACVDSLNITKAISIVVRDYSPSRSRPILIASSGQPCIKIQAGVQYVVLDGLGIEATRAGAASCIVGRATEIAMRGVTVRYDGEGSAFDVGDSRIELAQTTFIGRTRQPVVKATGTIMAADVEIAATAIGAALETSGDSRLRDVRVVRLGDWTGSSRTRNSAGFIIAGMNRQQLVQIDGLYVDGFSRGIYVGGGDETALLRPVVRDSDWAVTLENANLRVVEGELEAVDVGIYAASGVVFASNNKIMGVMRSGIYADAGGQVRAVDNRVYARPEGCRALVTGFFNGELTCRPWFEAPELYRTPRDRARLDFDSYWPAPAITAGVTAQGPAELSGPPLAGAPVSAPQQGGAPR
ncbi:MULTISPECIES: hypothetical protein [unclassified Caulobacter]|uniref:hypothetical protein n=1 Tax=unclassified Caulobacter TaxID=2648921 RepID=UPI000782B0DF|nr:MULTISPECIES: hypothetical protein [unclassified Caulobacter]AZS20660.1 hypothetical protein CSW63_08370 [Caulobacter sp. FWC26]